MNPKTIALTGGGTGGHVFPLLSVYNYINNKDIKFIWIGEKKSLEERISQENKIEFHTIMSGKFRRYFDIKTFFEPAKIFFGIIEGIYYIWKYNIDTIFSKGGFVSIPLCIAGKIMGKKIIIHESDTVIGLSNKIIGLLATKVFFTFDNEKIDKKKYIKSSQILNPNLIKNIEETHQINEKQEVLVIAGSQGSKIIFENLLKIIENFTDRNFTIILGDKNTNFRSEFEKYENVIIYDFISQDDLAKILEKSDIAITRAGATSLWEQYYFGIKSVIIPLKSRAGNHQYHNGLYFKENFGSIILEENDVLNIQLSKTIENLKDFRKENLNLEGFLDAIKKIKKELK
ncbi:MAG: glycosyltransferase [Candidatus Gracilibacteria bacterium]|nr:glycosyltransferase [Candidatus Gracilibacteria bacterium]